MEMLTIYAKTRELKGRKTNELRKKGYIPAIVYGYKIKNKPIQINEKDFKKVFGQAGESTLVDLKIDGKESGKIIINDCQTDPLSDSIIHIDLYQVRMDKKITTNVSVRFTGESPAVKNKGGVLVKSHDKLEIQCLPKDLIHDIEVDISVLENIDDAIRVKDLKISDKIEIISDPEEVVASVAPQRSEEEMEELEGKVEEKVDEIKSAKEEKKEEEKEEESVEEEKKETKKEAKK